ncbi:MAG: CPBP family intramembrane metalloprotease [Deltaproteobacteria bacterium]|nr:MAG: CPBP family intramembrane metalloprotease [Deltaproteobacteria bacterium]
MRWPIVWTLYRKEMLETLRDRRTFIVMILLPILMYPLFGIIATQAQFAQQRKLKKTKFLIGVLGQDLPKPLFERLGANDDVKKFAIRSNWRRMLRNGSMALALYVRPGAKTLKHPEGQIKVQVYYASTQDRSRAVRQRVIKAFKWYQRELVKQRLIRLKIPKAVILPVVMGSTDVATVRARGRYILSTMLPLLLLIMTITGAFYPAIDLTAGEKERGTLETLLTAPLRPIEIVAGKYLTVASIATITGGLNILSMWFTFAHGIRLAAGISKAKFSLGLEAYHMFAIMGFLLLVAAFAGAFMIAIASLARSFKEAQNFVTPAYLAAFLPIFMTTLPGSKGGLGTAWVPLVNTSFAIRHTLRGTLTGQYLAITLVTMGLAIAVTLYLASQIFAHEQVLFREGEYSIRGLFNTEGLRERAEPSIQEALFLLGIQFLLMFYVGIPLQKSHPAMGLAVTLWVLILLPPIFFMRWRKINVVSTLRLHRFKLLALGAAVLMGLGALPWVVTVTQYSMQFLPNAAEFQKQMNDMFTQGHFKLSGTLFFLLISLSPGICEEILFRGFIQSALLKKMRPTAAIVITAFLFGAYHLSIYRLLPTTLLGIMLGWICYRSGSIIPAILVHALNNAMALFLSSPSTPKTLQTIAAEPTTLALVVATGVFGLGVFMMERSRSSAPSSTPEASAETAPTSSPNIEDSQ